MPRQKTFAQHLVDWRRKMKLNRVEASELLGVPYRTLQDWELETHSPSPSMQTIVIRCIDPQKPYTHLELMTFRRPKRLRKK